MKSTAFNIKKVERMEITVRFTEVEDNFNVRDLPQSFARELISDIPEDPRYWELARLVEDAAILNGYFNVRFIFERVFSRDM